MFGNTVIGNSSLVICIFLFFFTPPCPLYSGLGGHDLTIFSNELYKHTSHLHTSHCPFYDVGGGALKGHYFGTTIGDKHTHTHTPTAHTHTHTAHSTSIQDHSWSCGGAR